MATTTDITQRIERSLRMLLAEIDDLPTLAAEWESLPAWNRASVSMDWDHLMATYLAELDAYARHGEMSPDQAARYRRVLQRLRNSLPTIEHLHLYRPPVTLPE